MITGQKWWVTVGSAEPASEQEVKAHMRSVIAEHVDLDTLEVNTTTLAEDVAQHFGAYGPPPEYEIPEDYFDWALEIEHEWDADGGVSSAW